MCVIEIQEKDEGQKSIGTMTDISPNLVKTINLRSLKKKKNNQRENLKTQRKSKTTPRHMVIKFLTTNYKEKNLLKVVQDRRACHTQTDRQE